MPRKPIHTVLIPCALMAVAAVLATAPMRAREQAAVPGSLDVIDRGSEAACDDDGGARAGGALAVRAHRSIHIASSIAGSIEAALAQPALDARERVSMNGGRRL